MPTTYPFFAIVVIPQVTFVRQGHQETLFATGDLKTSARLISPWSSALRFSGSGQDDLAPHLLILEYVAKRAHEFDIIHFHLGRLHFPLARRLAAAHLTTIHSRLDIPQLVPLYDVFPTFRSSPFPIPNTRR